MRRNQIESHQQRTPTPAASTVSIQGKLTIGAINDPSEHEADTTADKVMSMSSISQSGAGNTDSVQRKCADCEEEEKAQRKPLASYIQKKESNSGGIASEVASNRIEATKGGGSELDRPSKSFMENRFGADFSDVRIHTGNDAAQLSGELNAEAFTVGKDIYFNEGKYAPESSAGKHLLAHELTHTIQQSGSQHTAQQKQIQRDPAPAPPRKTIWVNIGFDSSAAADEATMKKLYASIASEKAAIKSCCSVKSKACDVDVKTNYDWVRYNKPAPSDGDYDNDDAKDSALRDKNLGKITAPNGGIKILVTESTLSQTWEGKRIFPRANTGTAGVLWNPKLAADDTIAHESGHAAGYVGDAESHAHSSDKHNIMAPGSIREADATPDDNWCEQMTKTAV